MDANNSESDVYPSHGTQQHQQHTHDDAGALAEVHFADICHKVPFPVLQQHLGCQGRSLGGLRATSKASQELVNSLITEAKILLRRRWVANWQLAKCVSQLLQLKKLTASPATEGPYRVDCPVVQRDAHGQPFRRGPAPDDDPLCQFAGLVHQPMNLVTTLDVGDWQLSLDAALLLVQKFPCVEDLSATIGDFRDRSQLQLFVYMSQLTRLRRLKLGLQHEPLHPSISLLTHITHLDLVDYLAGSIASLNGMTNLKSLSNANHSGSWDEPDFPALLKQLTGLQDLRVFTLDERDIDALADALALTRLEFMESLPDSVFPSMPLLQEVHSPDAAAVASILAACHNVAVVHLGHQQTCSFQREVPDECPPEIIPMSWHQKVEKLRGLAAIDTWVTDASGCLTADTLLIRAVDDPQFWDFLNSVALQELPPVRFFKRLRLDCVCGISHQVLHFLATKFPGLTSIQMRLCSFQEGVTLLPLVRLPLVQLQVMRCTGLPPDRLATVRYAFDKRRPGQVAVTVE